MLLLLEKNPGRNQTEIANTLGILRPNFGAALDGLESRDLCTRMRSTNDRRSHVLMLTDKGRAVLARAKKLVATKHEARLNELLGPANRAALLAMLSRIARGILKPVIPGRAKREPQMRNCASGNIEDYRLWSFGPSRSEACHMVPEKSQVKTGLSAIAQFIRDCHMVRRVTVLGVLLFTDWTRSAFCKFAGSQDWFCDISKATNLSLSSSVAAFQARTKRS